MRICVIGAGAIGGYLAARLLAAGANVTVIARGAALQAIDAAGLCLREAGREQWLRPTRLTADTTAAGAHDVVILGVKAHQLAALAPMLPALYHDDTVVVPAQNGIPWWYFQRHGGPHEGCPIRAVDPDGTIAAAIPIERIIGCVVYPATELVAPGVIQHVEGDRFVLGEPDGTRSPRIQALAGALIAADLRAPIRPRIRAELWVKLWGNLAFNPISALTRATLDVICATPATRALAAAMMAEAQAVAEGLGIAVPVSIAQRIDGAARVGAHKTSMLQDIEAGRATEVDALVGAVAELGRLTGVPTPHIDAIYAATALLDTTTRRP
ncbi:MAG: 2-dehydropantoate 2-reductase [Chloroflexi bacterium]|nr:2-dehydropantoate 2-reductase [Chloroflexota bacterium]